jgi:GNAT superfamily N-acetyltransferase
VEVREAVRSDWPAVAALLAELGRPDVRGDPAHEDAFAAYLARSDSVAFVAEDGAEIVGFVDLDFRQRLTFSALEAWIPDLIVAEGARGRGVGAALLGAAEERARERGCFGLKLESAMWRDRAHAFYVREGLQHTGNAFHKGLSDEDFLPKPR